jgi:hypothetical protein
MSTTNLGEAAVPGNLTTDRPPTACQSPMPRRRREMTPAGLDSMAAMERALEETVKQDHRAEKAPAPAYDYSLDPQYRFGKMSLDSPPAVCTPIPPPPPSPTVANPFVMEMPLVRGYASLQEAMSCPDKLKERYGRGEMSACSLVAYVEGVLDFISPSAADDFYVESEPGWQVIRDRVIDLLESGQNAAYILCNEDRVRKGQPLIPDPKPGYTNDYAKPPCAIEFGTKTYTSPKEAVASKVAGVRATCASSLESRFDKWEDINPDDVVVVKGVDGDKEKVGHFVKVKESDDGDADDKNLLRAIPADVMKKLQERWQDELAAKLAPKEATADDVALDAAGRAEELMKEKKEFDESQQKEWDKLPLFHPGKTYTAEQAANGYRVMDGYAVSYNQNDDLCVSTERTGPYEAGKTMTVINRWSDGGLAWMYWTNKAPKGSNGMLLRECVVRHGMGGWVDKKNDRRAKVVFLDAERSIQPGRCFIVAMDIPSNGNRMLVKGNELSDDVFRVFRSAVPDDIQKVITLRELINARQLAEAKGDESMRCPGWWHM